MSSITAANLPELFDADGDVVGYALPDHPPATVRIKFIDRFVNGENVDDLVYRAEWSNGIWAESFTMLAGWAEVHRETMVASSRAKLARVDAALVAA